MNGRTETGRPGGEEGAGDGVSPDSPPGAGVHGEAGGRPDHGGQGAGGAHGDGSDLGGTEVVDAEVVEDPVDGSGGLDGSGGDVRTEIIDGTAPELDAAAQARAERDEYLDALRRLQAEFENYKKRVVKQQSDQMARAAVSLVEKVLPVLDTLDLATEHLGDPESADGRALLAASGQLRDVLAKEGLERIDPIGEAFDPNAHEAVGQVPADTAGPSAVDSAATTSDAGDPDTRPADAEGDDTGAGAGSGEPLVAQVMRPGYRWRGAVVRPAMVMVRG